MPKTISPDNSIPLEPVAARKDVTKARYTVFCCQGSDCCKNGARETLKALREEIRAAGLKREVHVIKTQCTDKCKDAPVVIACSGCSMGEGRVCGAVWYRKVKAKDAPLLVEEHLKNDRILKSKTFNPQDE